jgi:hypothetical protein
MKKTPFHSILFAVYPVMALFAVNVSEIPFEDTRRGFYASLFIGVISLGTLRLIIKDWHKAALIASMGLFLFFNYGHVFFLIQGFSIGPILIGRTLVLAPFWALIWVDWGWFVLRRLKNSEEITRIFNLIALVLILFPLYTISSYAIQRQQVRRSFQSQVSPVLTEQFEGTYSLSSSLNMEHLTYLGDIYEADAVTKEPLLRLLAENKLFQIFKEYGYQTVTFETGLHNTELRDADIYIKPSPEQIKMAQVDWALNSFEENLVYTTMTRILFDLSILQNEEFPQETLETPYKLHRLNVLNIISRFPDFSQGNEPHFVFAHIISPHPPYVFGPNGEEILHEVPFSLSGPGRIKGGAQEVKQYIDQLTYLDTIILEMLDKIISQSEVQPIIIIQADHGPNAYTSVDQLEKGNMKEQYAILNAYYFPDGNYSLLYPTITPVNSFRAVLNTYFGGTYEFLPDTSYISPHYRRFEFIDVTERAKNDPLIP